MLSFKPNTLFFSRSLKAFLLNFTQQNPSQKISVYNQLILNFQGTFTAIYENQAKSFERRLFWASLKVLKTTWAFQKSSTDGHCSACYVQSSTFVGFSNFTRFTTVSCFEHFWRDFTLHCWNVMRSMIVQNDSWKSCKIIIGNRCLKSMAEIAREMNMIEFKRIFTQI